MDYGRVYPQQFCPAESKAHPPSKPNIHSNQPQNFVFLGRTTLFLVQDPLGDPLPSLPVSLSRSVPLSGSGESNIAQAPIEKRAYTMGSFWARLCLH